MIQDTWTVMRKELQELLMASQGAGSLLRLLIWVGILGVFLPLQAGVGWLSTPATLFTWTWFPLFVVSSVIAGAFAGERERHTLETLLATRLPDRAILFGKIGAGVAYGWGLTLVSILLSGLVVKIAFNPTRGFFPLLILVCGITLSLLGALLASGLGVLISLRAPTARQAQQTLSFAMMLLFFIPVFGLQALPKSVQAQVAQVLTAGLTPGTLALAIGVLLGISGGLLGVAMARFRRDQLILD
jgi:ABC-2 type transport system permease protein